MHTYVQESAFAAGIDLVRVQSVVEDMETVTLRLFPMQSINCFVYILATKHAMIVCWRPQTLLPLCLHSCHGSDSIQWQPPSSSPEWLLQPPLVELIRLFYCVLIKHLLQCEPLEAFPVYKTMREEIGFETKETEEEDSLPARICEWG